MVIHLQDLHHRNKVMAHLQQDLHHHNKVVVPHLQDLHRHNMVVVHHLQDLHHHHNNNKVVVNRNLLVENVHYFGIKHQSFTILNTHYKNDSETFFI